jgi:hypothetical protein
VSIHRKSLSLLEFSSTNMPSNVGSLKNRDSEDAFVNVMFQEERNGEIVNKGGDSFYDEFVEKGEILALCNTFMLLIKNQLLPSMPTRRFKGTTLDKYAS